MTLGQYISTSFSVAQYLEFALRIFLAGIVGIIIGNERSRRFKGVGVYTHIIVCCAAALIMIVSKYGFADLTNAAGSFPGTRGADSARIAAQAISGISFLCAGVIFKQGSNIKGLTTAAGIWLTLTLGLTLGAGLYILAAIEMIVLFIMKCLFRKIKFGYDAYFAYQMNFTVNDDQAFDALIEEQFKKWNVTKVSSKNYIWNPDGTVCFELTVHCKDEINFKDFSDFLKANNKVVKGATYTPHE